MRWKPWWVKSLRAESSTPTHLHPLELDRKPMNPSSNLPSITNTIPYSEATVESKREMGPCYAERSGSNTKTSRSLQTDEHKPKDLLTGFKVLYFARLYANPKYGSPRRVVKPGVGVSHSGKPIRPERELHWTNLLQRYYCLGTFDPPLRGPFARLQSSGAKKKATDSSRSSDPKELGTGTYTQRCCLAGYDNLILYTVTRQHRHSHLVILTVDRPVHQPTKPCSFLAGGT